MNHLLRSGQIASTHPALIINEFGTLGVDGALVKQRRFQCYEINKGSIFCICTKTEFLKALAEITEIGKHRTLFIEATGIAETCDIESFLDAPHIADAFDICGNVCVIDAVDFTRVAAYLKPATTQVYAADVLIINKCDQVDKLTLSGLRSLLNTLNPRAVQIETEYGQMAPEQLGRIQHQTNRNSIADTPPADIIAVSISVDKVYDRSKLYATLDEHKDRILRLKGNIDFGNGIRFIEKAGASISETDPCHELKKRSGVKTAFTVIAWDIKKDILQQLLTSCAL